MVTWFQMIRHHRGRLTVEQLKREARARSSGYCVTRVSL
jgi:hypothetical protein